MSVSSNSTKKLSLYIALIGLVIYSLGVFNKNEVYISNTEYGNKITMGDFYYSRAI